jgi:hypothetical protein
MYFFQDNVVSPFIFFTTVAGGVPVTMATTRTLVASALVFAEGRMSPANPGVMYIYVNGVFQFTVSGVSVPIGPRMGPFAQCRRVAGVTGTTNIDLHKGFIRFASERVKAA